jgi:hypothetical protein
MKKKFIGALATALLALAALGSTSASAATEFGDNCVANEASEGAPITFFALTASGNPLPLTAPSAGVITEWKSNLVPAPVSIPQTLKVLRQTGANTVQIIGESSQSITGGTNTFDARIPVEAGDRLGLFGSVPFGNLFCTTPGVIEKAGGFEGGGGSPGSTATFVEVEVEARFPVFAVLEPDADKDGFGDETQDQCPQNAAVQAPCPVVKLSVSSLVKKTFARVLVTSNIQAPVTVKGTVNLGKGKKARLSGGTQVVVPGTIAKFTLLFPAALKERLKTLSRKQSLRLALTATAPNVVGTPTTRKLKVKIKGQEKPTRKGKKGKGKTKGKGGKRG